MIDRQTDRQIDKLISIAPIYSKETLSASVAKSFQRLCEGVDRTSRQQCDSL